MKRPFWLFTLLSCACATTHHVAPGATSTDSLAATSRIATDYGQLVYEGAVFDLTPRSATPRFHYERRVRHQPDGLSSTSFTHDDKDVVLVEVAEHSADYSLSGYTEFQFQLGEVSRVSVKDGRVEFRRLQGETEQLATESVSQPVVVGPTLYGFALHHWDQLLAGQVVPFRFAVTSRLETVGFELRRLPSAPDVVRIEMRPQSPLISLIVDPLVITWSSADRQLVSLDGRVPTRVFRDGAWRDFDAHVEYQNRSSFE